jgi:hypothetical protein
MGAERRAREGEEERRSVTGNIPSDGAGDVKRHGRREAGRVLALATATTAPRQGENQMGLLVGLGRFLLSNEFGARLVGFNSASFRFHNFLGVDFGVGLSFWTLGGGATAGRGEHGGDREMGRFCG